MFYTIINSKKVGSGKSFLFFLIILNLTLFGFSSCNFQKKKKKQIKEVTGKDYIFPYDLENPDAVYHLPLYLEEISGISCYKKNKIACVQDEQAIIYIIDTEKGKVTSKLDFGKDDDYEDITIVGDNAYVLRSDGAIFKVKNFKKKGEIKTIKIETSLNKLNNTEGLVFDKSTNSLLIACKGSPSINEKEHYEGFKAIYRFDFNNNRLVKKPAYLVDLSKTDSIKDTGTIEKYFIETAIKLKLTGDGSSFHPSAIAIHPIDESKIYIISGVEKLLIIMNKNGLIIDILKLDKRIFNQPEGICFSENGDLFISNEGENRGGNILKFKPINKFILKK